MRKREFITEVIHSEKLNGAFRRQRRSFRRQSGAFRRAEAELSVGRNGAFRRQTELSVGLRRVAQGSNGQPRSGDRSPGSSRAQESRNQNKRRPQTLQGSDKGESVTGTDIAQR